jgi:hypothetical protein
MRRAMVVLAVGALMLSVGNSASALEQSEAWGQVPSPNVGSLENELAGLAVVGPNDIWAVGRYNSGRPPTATGRDTLALRWNGTAWSAVPTPNPTWAAPTSSRWKMPKRCPRTRSGRWATPRTSPR